MIRKTAHSALFATVLMIATFLANTAFGQLFTPYTITRTTGNTYNSIMGGGGGIYPASTVGWHYSLLGDDMLTYPISLGGWTFNYDNVNMSAFMISTNGFITFDTTTSSIGGYPYGYVNTEFSDQSSPCCIAPMWDDLVTESTNYSQYASWPNVDSCVKYKITGSSGNHVLTVEWANMSHYAASTADINFQLKLYESDYHIEFIYGSMTPGNVTWSFSSGLSSNQTPYTSTAQLLAQQTVNTTSFTYTASDNLSSMPSNNSMIIFNRNTRDLGAISLASPVAGSCTYPTIDTVKVIVHNYGTVTQTFTNLNPVVVYSVVTTPSGTTTCSATVTSGTLAANSDMTVTVGTINMSTGGNYTFLDSTNYATDLNINNNVGVSTTVTVGAVIATATSSTTICSGGSVNLSCSTPGFGHVFSTTYAPISLTSPTTVSLTNDAYTTINIPFTFKYFCNNYSSFILADNGNIQFSSAYSTYLNHVIPGNVLPNNIIAFAFSDLNNPVSGSITYQTMGTIPYRYFVLNFNNVAVFDTTGITTQVILYETTNLIEIHETTVPSHNYTQGIQDNTGAGYTPTGRNDLTWSATNDAYQFTSCPTYSWSPGATLNDSTSATPLASPTVTTTYTVTLNPGSACTKTSSVTVIVTNPLGAIQPIVGDSILCAWTNTSFKIPAITNATSYVWDNSNLSGSTITTGQGTDSITLNVGGSLGGSLRVRGYNSACNAYTAWVSIYILIIPNNNSSANQWVGGVSTNWFNVNNWCGGLPNSTTSADIDGYLGGNYGYFQYFPVINASGAVTLDMILEGDFDTLTISGSNNLDVYGNWIMANSNSISTFIPNTSTVTFKGSTDQSMSNPNFSSLTLPFYNLTINKGSSTATLLEDLYGQQITVSHNLSLVNGLFLISEPTSTVQFSSAPTIPATAGIDLNGGVITPGNYSITNNGVFRINNSSSDITIGATAGNSITTSGSGGSFEMYGGNLTVTGQLIVQNGASFTFDESSATYTYSTSTQILLNTMGVASNTKATFDVDATSSMDLEQGDIIFENTNTGSADDFKIGNGSGFKIIGSANNLQFGDASSSSTACFKIIDSTSAINNLTINPTGGHDSVRLDAPLTIGSSGILNLHTGILQLNKNLLTLNNTSYNSLGSLVNLNTGAIQRSTGGYILSEDSINRSAIKWAMTTGNLFYVFPFGNTYGGYVPFSFKNTSTGTTSLKVATYAPTVSTSLHKPYPLTVTHLHSISGPDNSANVVNRFWQIDTSAVSGTVIGSVKFVFSNISGHDETPANAWATGGVAQRWSASGWNTPTNSAPTSNSSSGDTVSASGITKFSPWTLSRTAFALPIDLLNFTASYNGKSVDLNWTTASEINNDYFTVSKTVNQSEFDFVATVNGVGNSNIIQNYYAEDKTPFIGNSYYQLTQTDYNGNATKYGLVPIFIPENGLEIIKVYGDINGVINLTVNDNTNEMLSIAILDILGNRIGSQTINAIKGGNYIQIKPENLPQGVYFISVSNTAKRLTSKLVY